VSNDGAFHSSATQPRGRLAREFAVVFLPFALLLAVGLVVFYLLDLGSERRIQTAREKQAVQQARGQLTQDLDVVAADLFILAGSRQLRQAIERGTPAARRHLAEEFARFAEHRRVYDQLRYIDADGREVVRVNYTAKGAEVVAESRLQDKSRRYYVRQAMGLRPGQVYMSAFDLNVENGSIERPQKPVIRFATPVADARGRRRGLLALNYLGDRLLADVRAGLSQSAGEGMLLNAAGYWLYSPDRTRRWGFMFDNGETLARSNPELWQAMQAGVSQQRLDAAGLLTFTTIYPLLELERLLDNTLGTDRVGALAPAQTTVWKLATWVEHDTLYAHSYNRARLSAGAYAIVLAVWAIVSLGFARTRLAGQRARELVRKLSSSIEQTSDIVYITDRDGIIEYVNPGFEQVTGYSRTEAIGRRSNLLKSGQHGRSFYRDLWRTILEGRTFQSVLINRRKDGTLFYEQKTIAPLKDKSDRIASFVSTGKDVTEQMAAQQQLYHLAFHNPLTGLPNRAYFQDHLRESMQRARRQRQELALLFMDLDRFKNVNDSLGHEAGDRLLNLVGERLKACCRETDTVAHIGGDEFAVILEGVRDAQGAAVIAEAIIEALRAPFTIDSRELFVTVSIGVAMYPLHDVDAQHLVKYADTAMYRAKQHGRNHYVFYSHEMTERVAEQFALDTDLRHALEREEFLLHYQPIVELGSGRLLAIEALLRWQHPDRGLLRPAEFIAALEDSRLILPVSAWVVERACRDCLQLHEGLNLTELTVAVNLSPHCLLQEGLDATVGDILDKTGLAPERVTFEITETALIEDMERASNALLDLKRLGVRLAIDDFGTGYSSLNYLRRFHFEALKIDRSFVQQIGRNANDRALVTAIIAMAHNLGIEVIAEGVETTEQRALLAEWGCDAIQGYLCLAPDTLGSLARLARTRERWL